MLGKSDFITKMSESNIVAQYSVYLQQAWIRLAEELPDNPMPVPNFLLSYDEFKEYYIQRLVGKGRYLETLVHEFQFGNP